MIQALARCGTSIVNTKSIKNSISVNKTIMEYAIEFAKIQKWNKLEITTINYLRIFKKAILLYELVEINRYKMTEYL